MTTSAKPSGQPALDGRTAQHATFSIERLFEAAPRQVFAAWSTAEAKARWFVGPPEQWREMLREFDFTVGGRERLVGRFSGGTVSAFDCRYQDIVPDRRIVYVYDMHLDDRRISVSLSTVELSLEDGRTRMICTEQAVFLDGYDDAGSRERGTRAHFERLAAELRRAPFPEGASS